MELIWKDIPEAEGYAISNTGKRNTMKVYTSPYT